MRARRFARWPDLFRSPIGIAAALTVGGILVLAVIAPPIWSHAASKIEIASISQGSTPAHRLGTDLLGRDILSRVLVATRLSVTLAILASLLGAAIGVPVGALPSILGPRLGRMITGAINLAVAFPTLLLAIFVASIAGLGARGAVIGIAAAVAPYFARLTQTLSASVAGSDYVAAARVLGIGRVRLISRHVLPNVAEPLLLTLMLTIGDALLALAGLSFLGLGVQPPSYDWGGMLNEGLDRIYVTPIVVVGPAVAIILAALSFNLLGETLAKGARRQGTVRRPQSPRPVPTQQPRERSREGTGRWTGDGAGRPGPDRLVPGRFGSRSRRLDLGRAGRDRRHRRRVRVGQELDRDGDCRPPARPGGVDLGSAMALRPRPSFPRKDGTAKAARALAGGRLPGSDGVPQPGTAPGAAARRGRRGARRAFPQGGEEAVGRAPALRPDRVARAARPQLPARAVGRDAAAGDDRHGLDVQPSALVADEPTTALDVTVQQQILKLLDDVGASTGAAAIVISHNIAVVSSFARACS